MDMHAAAFAKVGLNASDVPLMARVVLGIWSTDALARLPAPMSNNMSMFVSRMAPGATCPEEPCLASVSPRSYTRAVQTPNAAARIHVANGDFALTGCGLRDSSLGVGVTGVTARNGL